MKGEIKMAIVNTQINQILSNGAVLILHPETIAEIVNYTDTKVIGATNVQDALDILAQSKKDTESSISTINTNVSNAQSRADSAYLLAGEAKSIAEGASRAFVYNTYTDMVNDLLSASNTKFKIGDNLLIIQTNVPDYWISSIGDKSATVSAETVSGTTGSFGEDPSGTGENIYYSGTISTTISANYSSVVVKSVTPLSASATISSYNSSTGAIELKIKSARPKASVQVTLNCTTEENVAEYGYYNIAILETQKVDLTDYQTKVLDNSITINGETKTTVNDSLTAIANYISGLKSGTNVVEKANKANQLVTARTISLSGDATGSISFDGSSNKTLSVTLANSGVTAGTYSVVTVDAKGRATSGGQIIEVGAANQTTPSSSLAVGGIFFKVI